MSDTGSLSFGNLMLNSAKLLAIDLPASWMMNRLAPPVPDLANMDIETKLKIMRGEEPAWNTIDAELPDTWWSPTAWIDRTEQWINDWIDTSKTLATSACEMKKQWDDLVAAKQAEREKQRLEEVEELDEEQLEESSSGSSSPHLLPNIIVTTPPLLLDEEPSKKWTEEDDIREPEKVQVSQKKRVFEQNSKQSYAEISKKITDKVQEKSTSNDLTTRNRQNWRNKELKVKPVKLKEKFEAVKDDDQVVTFSKTYSFRNLPRGKVAKLQQQFEGSGPIQFTTNKMVATTIKKSTGPQIFKRMPEDENKDQKPKIDIRSWEDSKVLETLDQPGSRHGFHASTPSLTSAIEKSIMDEKPKTAGFDNKFVKDYLEALKDRRDLAREKANDVLVAKQLLIKELVNLWDDKSDQEECKPSKCDDGGPSKEQKTILESLKDNDVSTADETSEFEPIESPSTINDNLVTPTESDDAEMPFPEKLKLFEEKTDVEEIKEPLKIDHEEVDRNGAPVEVSIPEEPEKATVEIKDNKTWSCTDHNVATIVEEEESAYDTPNLTPPPPQEEPIPLDVKDISMTNEKLTDDLENEAIMPKVTKISPVMFLPKKVEIVKCLPKPTLFEATTEIKMANGEYEEQTLGTKDADMIEVDENREEEFKEMIAGDLKKSDEMHEIGEACNLATEINLKVPEENHGIEILDEVPKKQEKQVVNEVFSDLELKELEPIAVNKTSIDETFEKKAETFEETHKTEEACDEVNENDMKESESEIEAEGPKDEKVEDNLAAEETSKESADIDSKESTVPNEIKSQKVTEASEEKCKEEEEELIHETSDQQITEDSSNLMDFNEEALQTIQDNLESMLNDALQKKEMPSTEGSSAPLKDAPHQQEVICHHCKNPWEQSPPKEIVTESHQELAKKEMLKDELIDGTLIETEDISNVEECTDLPNGTVIFTTHESIVPHDETGSLEQNDMEDTKGETLNDDRRDEKGRTEIDDTNANLDTGIANSEHIDTPGSAATSTNVLEEVIKSQPDDEDKSVVMVENNIEALVTVSSENSSGITGLKQVISSLPEDFPNVVENDQILSTTAENIENEEITKKGGSFEEKNVIDCNTEQCQAKAVNEEAESKEESSTDVNELVMDIVPIDEKPKETHEDKVENITEQYQVMADIEETELNGEINTEELIKIEVSEDKEAMDIPEDQTYTHFISSNENQNVLKEQGVWADHNEEEDEKEGNEETALDVIRMTDTMKHSTLTDKQSDLTLPNNFPAEDSLEVEKIDLRSFHNDHLEKEQEDEHKNNQEIIEETAQATVNLNHKQLTEVSQAVVSHFKTKEPSHSNEPPERVAELTTHSQTMPESLKQVIETGNSESPKDTDLETEALKSESINAGREELKDITNTVVTVVGYVKSGILNGKQLLQNVEILSNKAIELPRHVVTRAIRLLPDENSIEEGLKLGLSLTTGLSLIGLSAVTLVIIQEFCFDR